MYLTSALSGVSTGDHSWFLTCNLAIDAPCADKVFLVVCEPEENVAENSCAENCVENLGWEINRVISEILCLCGINIRQPYGRSPSEVEAVMVVYDIDRIEIPMSKSLEKTRKRGLKN